MQHPAGAARRLRQPGRRDRRSRSSSASTRSTSPATSRWRTTTRCARCWPTPALREPQLHPAAVHRGHEGGRRAEDRPVRRRRQGRRCTEHVPDARRSSRPMSTKFVLGLGGTVDYEIALGRRRCSSSSSCEYGIRADELDLGDPGRLASATSSQPARVRPRRCRRRAVRRLLRHRRGVRRAVRQAQVTLGGHVRAGGDRDGRAGRAEHAAPGEHRRPRAPAAAGGLSTTSAAPTQDTLDPHLIVQYPAGRGSGSGDIDFVAPHPNRRDLRQRPAEPRAAAQRRAARRAARRPTSSWSRASTSIQDPATLDVASGAGARRDAGAARRTRSSSSRTRGSTCRR